MLILADATTNTERWRVFSNSKIGTTQDTALKAILENAETFEELWDVYLCASERITDDVLTTIEVACKTTLRLATSNLERWNVHKHASDTTLKEQALSEILAASTSDGERWMVFFCSKNNATRGTALNQMFKRRFRKKI